jgi:hypothetical protein
MGRKQINKICWLENLKGGDYSEDLGVGGKIILEWILGQKGGKMWTGCIWLRKGTNGSPLRTR